MVETIHNGRATIHQTSSELEIIIPTYRYWFIIVFASLWLCGWAYGEITAIQDFIIFNDFLAEEFIFISIWLLFWTAGGLTITTYILWQLFGQEKISVTQGLLTIEHSLLNIRRTKRYAIHNISNLTVTDDDERQSFLSFEYGMQTIYFASQVGLPEARAILKYLYEFTHLGET